MFLWIVMAALAATASLSVLVPLYRGRRRAVAASAAEVAIYKDQLGELDRDLGRGLIAVGEAGAARTEIARRLLKADAVAPTATSPAELPRLVAAIVAVVAVPLAALGLYLAFGSPQLPDRPLAARLEGPLETEDIAALVARVEARLNAAPDDARGWELLGPTYLQLGRYDDAIRAYQNTIRLLGGTAERETGLGEAIMRANGDVVTEDARAALQRASNLDPAAVKPRFFLAVALTQEGRKDEAIAAWQALLQGAPADASWVPLARNELARLQASASAQGPAAPGPSAADVDAAGKLSPEDRLAMIEGMVGQLAARLESNPSDAEGWARLIRSYMVLGRKADAEGALAKAHAALMDKPERMAVVEAAARSAGLIQ